MHSCITTEAILYIGTTTWFNYHTHFVHTGVDSAINPTRINLELLKVLTAVNGQILKSSAMPLSMLPVSD